MAIRMGTRFLLRARQRQNEKNTDKRSVLPVAVDNVNNHCHNNNNADDDEEGSEDEDDEEFDTAEVQRSMCSRTTRNQNKAAVQY